MAKKARKRRSAPARSRVIVSHRPHGSTVSIVPSDGYPTQVQAQWQHHETRQRRRRTVAGVRLSAEGRATGRDQKTVLQNLAAELHSRLDAKLAMPGDPGGPSWSDLLQKASPKTETTGSEAPTNGLTVRDALAIAYGKSYAEHRTVGGRMSSRHGRQIKDTQSNGLAVSTWSEHARELRRLADVVEEVLGPTEQWDWSEFTFNRLRDRLTADVKNSEEATAAPRKLRRVHKLLQLYIRATRLLQNHFTDRDDVARKPRALTIERWLRKVKTAWNTAGLELSNADQPRYEQLEAGKIFIEGISNRHDPRYRLWLQLGAEGRPGQILRARRSHLEARSPELKGGVFRGPGTALKLRRFRGTRFSSDLAQLLPDRTPLGGRAGRADHRVCLGLTERSATIQECASEPANDARGVRDRACAAGRSLGVRGPLEATPSGDRVFVVSKGSTMVEIVDRYRETISGKIELGRHAEDLRVDPLGRYLLARTEGIDSVLVIALGTNRVTGTPASKWREDLPFVAPDGDIALAQVADVALVDAETLCPKTLVRGGASDFWYAFRWTGFRPRDARLDKPVDCGGPPVDSTLLPADSFAALLAADKARARAAQIKVGNEAARVVTAMRDGTAIYRVVLGPYATKDDAERIGSESKQSFWVYEEGP